MHLQQALSSTEGMLTVPDHMRDTDLTHEDLRGGFMDASTLDSEDMAFLHSMPYTVPLLVPSQQQSLVGLPSTVIGPTDPCKCNYTKAILCENVAH